MTFLPTWFITSVNKFPDKITVLIASFKSSAMQHDVHLLNYHPIYSEMDDILSPGSQSDLIRMSFPAPPSHVNMVASGSTFLKKKF